MGNPLFPTTGFHEPGLLRAQGRKSHPHLPENQTGRHLGDCGSSLRPAPPSPSHPACRCDSAAIICVTSAWLGLALPSLLGFAEPGKSIAAVC